jgi:hypothetical protein
MIRGPKISKQEAEARIKKYHGALGHFGLDNTCSRIRDNGEEWDGMRKQLRDYISNCEFCIKNKASSGDKLHVHSFSNSYYSPNEAWALDLMSLGEDAYGYKYILVIIDLFHRYLTLIPLKTLYSQEIIYHMWKLFNSDGMPDIIISDLGTNLTAADVESVYKFLGSQNISTPPRSKQHNAVAERVIQEVREQLSIRMQELQQEDIMDSWSIQVPYIQKIHNIREHYSTGVAPADLKFQDARALTGSIQVNSYEDLLQRAREGLAATSEQRYFKNKHSHKNHLQIGDLVWRLNPSFDKMNVHSTRRLGPYEVIDTDETTALLEAEDESRLSVVLSELVLFRRPDK